MTDAAKIREQNDLLRKTFKGGRVLLGLGVVEHKNRDEILNTVRRFDCFDERSDPAGLHEWGAFESGNDIIVWQIDYESGSTDPADPESRKIIVIMLGSDY